MAKNKIIYPLEQVLEIKIKRVKDAEKVAQEKRRILEKEEKKLSDYEAALKKVDDHHRDKLQQLRDGLDEGIQPYEIDQMKRYLKEVKIKRLEEQRKVDRQKKQVETAQKNLKIALDIVKQKQLEVDKLEMHKKEWLTEQMRELKRQEAKNLDEVGSLVFLSNRRREQIELEQQRGGEQDG